MVIINKKIDDLIPYVNNPRNNKAAIDKVASSIKNFGFKVPIVIDKNNEIITGHTRLMASKKLNLKEVPCVIADDLTEAQIKAYRIADNKTAEFSEWDMELLNVEFEALKELNFDLDLTGFDSLELDNLFDKDVEVKEDEFNLDEAINQIEEPISKKGQIYKLGNHRLMCGDSTNFDDVKKLMDGNKAHVCWTDPPYNINYGNIKHPKFKQREIENDNMSQKDFREFCLKFTERIKENVLGCVYMAGPPGPDGRIMFTVADELLHCSTTIIWNKDQFTLGRGKYQNKYEPIWFGWVENGSRFTNDRTLTNVWDIKRPKKSELHPTMKPVEIVVKSLEHSSLKTDIVLDLFGGSGTTLIACEQINRYARLMELDPKYCDVIINRWETLTGLKAELISE